MDDIESDPAQEQADIADAEWDYHLSLEDPAA
jgi:hypothetical protein